MQGSLDADRIAHLHVPVVQLNTGSGFGGECHLDANMVRSALPALPLADLDLLIVENVGNLVCPAEFRIGEDVARDDLLGHRGRGQAAQVPADVPRLRARRGQQDRPARPTSTTTSTFSGTTSTASTPACRECSLSAKTGEGVEAFASWLREVAAREAVAV